MLDKLIRYSPALQLIARERPRHILDVGCGEAGIGSFYGAPYTGCDVDFGPHPAAHMRPVSGTATALPFPDAAFDLVLSLDMLEHLLPDGRGTAIEELVRVSRKWVVFGCPCGPKAWQADTWLYRFFQWRRQVPVWITEHMAAPFLTRAAIEAELSRLGVSYKVLDNESILIHLAIIAGGNLLGSRLQQRFFSPAQENAPAEPPVNRRLPWLLAAASRICTGLRLGTPYRQIFIVEKEQQRYGK